ncbi:MAG: VWA domain-containing protein, partial [Lentisphaerota bacterium]
MNFLNNLILWFIPVVVLAVLLLIWRARVRRSQVLKSLLGVRWNDPEHVLISPARRSLRLWLFIAGILLLMAAVARPYWGSQLIPYEAKGRDVMILFDVSKSMLSEDIQPSRLEHAKWLLRQLVNDSNGDRFGLVAFAGNAFLECPMTTDKTSFIQYVDELNTSSIPLGGTNLQLALETAVKAFDAAESTNRAIVLITDGDELSGDSSRVLDALRNQKIPLFIVGLGDPANPAVIPIKRGPGETPAFMRDAAGNLVKTKLNEQQLVKLAKETGGIYVRSTVTDPGLDQIRQRIKALVPKDMDKGIRTRPIERLYYPLGLSLALLLVWFILSERETPLRPRKALLLFLLPGLLIAASGAKAADNDAAATDAAQPAAALPSDAADETSPAVQDKKSVKDKPAAALPDAVKTYNEGHDLQLRKDESAAKLYEQAINMSEKNPAVRARAYQNLGVIEHNKARQEMMQSVEQVKGQNLDGALEKLSGSEKILDKAEEMYVKSMSIKTVQPDTGKSAKDSKNPEVKKTAEDQKIAESGTVQLEQNRAEVAIDQQKLLFDRDMIAALRKKIEELKKKQEEARKKTEEARKQQQQKQDQKQDQNKQDQNKQDQNKQDQ